MVVAVRVLTGWPSKTSFGAEMSNVRFRHGRAAIHLSNQHQPQWSLSGSQSMWSCDV
uniref:Uncharacterized protein n=1 Tax=Physcomitrium patens TaxID=3218 RepID=A0A2K1IBN1_PHYPA|nr:hypothetical protein PHYPA_030155 [Physcomitrium patens]